MPRSQNTAADARGVGLVLTAALGFAGMALWAKEAYAAGWAPDALVAARFVLVALAFWAIVLARGTHRRVPPPRRLAAAAFGLGLTAYALENHLYFAAAERIDAGLLALLMSLTPAIVVGGAVLLGRERPDGRRVLALTFAVGGAALVLAGGARGAGFDAVGAMLALGSATAYANYLLAGDRLVGRLDPFLLAALASSGAAVSLVATALASGDAVLPGTAAAYGDLLGLVALSSVLPVAALWLGIRRLGAPTASIIGSVEPAITVTFAALLLGEHLGDLQLVGGVLVVAAVVVLNLRRPGRPEPVPTDIAAAAA